MIYLQYFLMVTIETAIIKPMRSTTKLRPTQLTITTNIIELKGLSPISPVSVVLLMYLNDPTLYISDPLAIDTYA